MIRHSSNIRVLSKTESETTIFVKNSTPYVSALKRIDRLLEKFDKSPINHKQYQQGEYKKVKYITAKAMGSAMEKAISIALNYQEKQGHQVDILTGTVKVVDEVKTKETFESRDDSDEETELRSRNVSYVEVRVWLKRK